MRNKPGTRTRIAAFATGILLAVGGAVLAPSAAFADDDTVVSPSGTPESPPASTAPAEVVAPAEPAADPAPVEVVVTSASPEEVLAEDVSTAKVTVFTEETVPAATSEETPVTDEPATTDEPIPDDDPTGPPLPPVEPDPPCSPAVCITNGTILLAVNPTGELNSQDGTGSPAGPGDVGLEYLPTGSDSTSPGCFCEGWGVADPATGTWGGANIADFGTGGSNLTLESFTHTDSTATSVVLVGKSGEAPVFRVTHDYRPSAETPNLYQVNVTIENVSGKTIAVVQYRRVMDWDIEPTAFSEFVTINTGTATAITFTSNDGFAYSNPLAGPSDRGQTGNFSHVGPDDQGALFDFTFGALAPGAKHSFTTFYGAAENEAEAIKALTAVGAEAYSFGQPNLEPFDGSPNTFIFAFGKVGGAPIFEPEPVDPVVPPPVAPEPQPAAIAPASRPEVVAAAPAARVLEATGGDAGAVLPYAAVGGILLALGAAAVFLTRGKTRRPTVR